MMYRSKSGEVCHAWFVQLRAEHRRLIGGMSSVAGAMDETAQLQQP